MTTSILQLARPRVRDPRLIAAVLLLATFSFFVALDLYYGAEPSTNTPYGFKVSPRGDAVSRLAPVQVTFRHATKERDGAKLLSIDPPVQGEYVWQGDRTLIFQPAFPGLLRGFDYTVKVAADGDNGLYQPFSFQFTTEDALSVQSVIPAPDDVEVPGNAQVLVQFSRSVAPLTTLANHPDMPVILFDPPLTGRGEWLNTSLYRFIPDAGAMGTFRQYNLRVPARLSDEPDGSLKQDYVWSFTTANPAIVKVTPDTNSKFMGPFQPVNVTFSQPMSRPAVEAGLRVIGPNRLPVVGTFAWSANDTAVTFTPAQAFEPDARHEVEVNKGLRGITGGETQHEWRSVFESAPLPRVVSTMPPDGSTAAERYGVSLQFSVPMDEAFFDGLIGVSGVAKEDITTGVSGESGSRLYVNVRLEPSTPYTVTLADGARDRWGRPVGPHTWSFTTGQRPPSLSLAVPAQIATYSASSEPVLYFHATNMEAGEFTLYPLTAAEMRWMWTNNRLDPHPPAKFQPSLPALYSWREDASGPRDQVLVKSTSLSRNGRPLPKGDYYVTSNAQNDWQGARMAFSVVDAAVITKVSFDELLVWALDLDSGAPLQDQRVAVSGTNIAANTVVRTNAEGLATVAVPRSIDSYPRGQGAFVAELTGSSYKGVSSTAWSRGTNTYSFSSDFGIGPELYPRKYVANVFTERPIYRPGEDVPYKAVVRLDDDAAYSVPAETKDVFAIIFDPQRKELAKLNVVPNEFGSFAGTFTVPKDAVTGDYYVEVYWEPSLQYRMPLARTSFVVAEFRKPEFQVSAETPSANYVAGDTVQAMAEATFFFGGPVEGASVTWATLTQPYSPRFKGFERYSFLNPDPDRGAIAGQPLRNEGTATIDAQGNAPFSFTASLSGDEGPQRYTIGASVTDQSAQLVGGYTAVTVHPASLYAGIRTDSYTAQSGREAKIDVVSVDIEGKPLPGRDVAVRVYNRIYVTTKEQTPEGGRRYVSTPRDTLLVTLNVTTGADAKGSVAYTPTTSGSLFLVAEVSDDKGRIARASKFLYVSGPEYVSWRIGNDDTMKLIADREQYALGDTAEVLVPAPFEGAVGLVTVERGKIIERYVQRFESNSETLRIPIVDRSLPNVYVSVVLYKAPTAADPVARYKVGYVNLPVSTDTRVLNVSIKTDREQTQPGETVRYDVKVTDSTGKGVRSELSVAVVDKALLSLADEKGVNGLKAFWFQRGLGVATSSSLSVSVNRSNDVIAEPSGMGKGGSGDEDRLRQDFRNTAFWEAQLVTDDSGNGRFEVPMPDNLTTWHTQIRAISGNILVGEGTNEIISAQPLLLRPALPRFFRVGDKPTLRTLVRNSTRAPQDVTVSLGVEGVTVASAQDQTQRIEPGNSAVFEWPATVEAEGSARVTFTARAPGLHDAVKLEMPIHMDVTQETMATGGVVSGKSVTETVYVPGYVRPDQGSLTVSVEASLLKSLGGQLDEFRQRHPIESADLVAGRIIATLAVQRADTSVHWRSNDQLRSDVAALMQFQRSDGGFAWCHGCSTDPGITAWALIAVGEWKRAGNNVDASAMARASAYLNEYVNRFRDVEKPADANAQAFYLYACTISSPAVESSVRSLFNLYRAQLTNSGRAYLLLAMAEAGLTKSDSQVRTILDDVASAAVANANGNHWENERVAGTQQSSPRTTALMLGALVRMDPEHPLIEETVRWLRVGLSTNVVRTRTERADTLKALAEFATKTGELNAEYGYEVKLDDLDVLSGRLKSGDAPETQKLTLASLTPGRPRLLQFARDFAAKGRMYYTMDLRYTSPAQQIDALSRGMSVSHEYSLVSDPAGKPISTARLGDNIRVKVTVMLPADRNYVVVEDLLPAGLEALDPKLKIADVKLKAQLDLERKTAARPQNLDYYAPWFRWYYNPWQQVDLRDDRVTLQAQRLTKGVYEFVYYARATTPGDYFVAPAHIEESFFPEVFGRSDSSRFTVGP